MNYTIHFTRSAKYDLENIMDYIAQDSINHALKTINELEKKIVNMLGMFPHSGTSYLDIRFFVFGNYIAIYKVDEETKTVYIYIIAEGHQQWRALLEERILNID